MSPCMERFARGVRVRVCRTSGFLAACRWGGGVVFMPNSVSCSGSVGAPVALLVGRATSALASCA